MGVSFSPPHLISTLLMTWNESAEQKAVSLEYVSGVNLTCELNCCQVDSVVLEAYEEINKSFEGE